MQDLHTIWRSGAHWNAHPEPLQLRDPHPAAVQILLLNKVLRISDSRYFTGDRQGTFLDILLMDQVEQLQYLRRIARGDEVDQLRWDLRRIIEHVGILLNKFIREENIVLRRITYGFGGLLVAFPNIHQGIRIASDTGEEPNVVSIQQIIMKP